MSAAGSTFQAVVLDMDGLLLDSERPVRDAWLDAARALDVSLTAQDYASVIGLDERQSRARMLELVGGDPHRLQTAQAHAAAWLDEHFGLRSFDVKPGALALLRTLRSAHVPCAVASSTRRAEVERRLARAGLLGYFEAVCGGDEVARGKPAPDLYALAVARLGAAANGCLALEDSGPGALAALAAGLAVVVIPDLSVPDAALQARCKAVLPSLEAVCEHSPEWFGIQCAYTA